MYNETIMTANINEDKIKQDENLHKRDITTLRGLLYKIGEESNMYIDIIRDLDENRHAGVIFSITLQRNLDYNMNLIQIKEVAKKLVKYTDNNKVHFVINNE